MNSSNDDKSEKLLTRSKIILSELDFNKIREFMYENKFI